MAAALTRAQGLLASALTLCVVGCRSDALVVVTVDAVRQVDGITSLRATVSAAGHVAAPFDVTPAGGPFSIPPARTFGIEIPGAFAGTVDVHVEALDATASKIISGDGSKEVSAGERADLTVTLGGVNTDGGMPDGACGTCSSLGIGCGLSQDSCGMTIDCGPCFVAAVHPPIAPANASVVLEGRFGPSPTVHFGSATGSVSTAGPERVTVLVPPGAVSGPLTVDTAGVTTAPVQFRRAHSTLAPTAWRSAYAQADVARQRPVLTSARRGAASVLTKAGLYVLGGAGSNSVELARTDADGSLGHFTLSSSTLTTVRGQLSVLATVDSVLAIGGLGNTGPLASIDRAAIAADGTIGTFSDAGVQLKQARRGASAVVIGGRIYVLGGASSADDSALLDSVEVATLTPGAAGLGAFQTVGSKLSVARANAAVEVVGTSLYVFGGRGASGPLASIERAPIAPDGTLGDFQVLKATLPSARSALRSIRLGSGILLVGGLSQSGEVATVDLVSLDGSEMISGVADAGVSLASPRAGHALELVGNTLYALGGDATDGKQVEHCVLEAGATLGPAADTMMALPNIGPMVVLGNWLYLVGGTPPDSSSYEASVWRMPIDLDGNLGAPTDTMLPLTVGRAAHSLAVIGDGLYAIGGGSGADNNTIDRAPIGPDGTLGAFARVNGITTLVTRVFAPALVVGDALYVIGGGSGVDRPKVDRSDIAADGSLGSFAAGPALANGRRGEGAALLGGAAWVVGGDDGSAGPLATEHATVAADGSTLGAFSALGTTGLGAHNAATVVVGDSYYALGGSVGGTSVPSTAIIRASIGAGGAIGSFAAETGNLLLAGSAYGARTSSATIVLSNNGTTTMLQALPLQ